MYDNNDRFSPPSPGQQQIAVIPRLMQVVASMHHIDELFQWLAQTLIHSFNIQVLVFWTNHVSQSGQLNVQFRTIARLDPSLPEQIIVNDQMQQIAQRLLNERILQNVQPIEALFSHYQTLLLKRYGLHFWGTCFNSRNALLPPRTDIFAQGAPPAFLAMTTLCFFKQSPPYNLVPTISLTLDKAMEMAETHHLLLHTAHTQISSLPFSFPQTPPVFNTPQTPPPFSLQETPPPQSISFSLLQLIPSRKQSADLLLSANPFAASVTISDKKARRFHSAIDGQATIAEICTLTGMSHQEIKGVLRLLWDQQRIEVREPGGKPVNLAPFLDDW